MDEGMGVGKTNAGMGSLTRLQLGNNFYGDCCL